MLNFHDISGRLLSARLKAYRKVVNNYYVGDFLELESPEKEQIETLYAIASDLLDVVDTMSWELEDLKGEDYDERDY